MKFNIIFKTFVIILIISQISMGFLIRNKRNKVEKTFCFNNACGWEIHKKTGTIEHVENNCICKPEEDCVRAAQEYRLPGFKYHCKRREEIKDLLTVVYFPQSSQLNNQQNLNHNIDE